MWEFLYLLKNIRAVAASAESISEYIQQHESEWTEKGFTVEHGTVTLTNTLEFPFNDSKQTVSLVTEMPNTTYAVVPHVLSSTGNAGEIEVSDRQVNGFKLATTGGGSSVTVEYIVIGGFTE